MPINKNTKSWTSRNKFWLVGAGVVVLLLVGWAVLYASNHKTTVATGVTPQPSPSSSSAAVPSGSGTTTPTPASTPAATPTPPPTSSIPNPTGSVLNVSTVSLTSTKPELSPAIDSTCQTIPGAKCGLDIKGPNGDHKSVAAKAGDSSGLADITWNAKTIGLTPGTWQVRLIATSGSAVAYGYYYPLEVQP